MKQVRLPYGKEFIELEVGDDVDILVSQAGDFKAEKSQEDLVRDALANPIGTEKLSELVKGKKTITIISSDHTRPVPSAITMPILLEEIRSTNPDAEITILIATGFHRPTTHEELVAKYGQEIVDNEHIVVHKSGVDEDMVELDTLPSGGRLLLNKHAINTDLLIAEGFIEPHFFAGFSGGRKSVLPGVASEKTVLANHCSKFIASDYSRTGILKENPIHKDMEFAAEQAKLAFILNVVIDAEKKIINAFAGDRVKAHFEGTEFVRGLSTIDGVNADIAITSNGGYPLDQNVYQSVKSMTAAEAAASDDGVIIEVSRCNDGHGGESFYKTFKEAAAPKDIEDRVLQIPMEETIPDQWEIQILARILVRHKVIFVTDPENRQLIEDMHMTYAENIEEALRMAKEIKGEDAKIAFVPDGVSVIVNKKK
ncbi:nickel-dependent lactate racemase [Anaerococcus degeneri]|uniref:Nickel-dependent lactate racemase n=1 Tax=Anaerococcus degeneri TaxID=361500 RepID=A0ABS7YYA2_9FIRM|nr:nickel-dependent lactate racemase [Anaerococcus degeneri]MBP2016098.1 nickel-dependent lactate racemase [Anaerococcus degeneri]MCA2096425.1 nickel-dependent lactate racemase [Anaerococcus degeneri]